jgi:Sulfotransferase family
LHDWLVSLRKVAMPSADPRVLYVLGIYHSGTTLLGNLAGQLDGFFSVGELRSFWRKATLPNARCGCGTRLSECAVWSPILRSVLGQGEEREALARDMWQCQREVVHEVHTWLRVPSLLRKRANELQAGTPLARYAEGLERLYRAIAQETGAEVIVDSSKEPTDAALLLLMPGIQTTFVQIIRDPRGMVNSILRFRDDGQPVVERRLPQSMYAALSWSLGNMAAAAVRRSAGPARSTLLRYEDFIDEPGETIEALAKMAGRPAQLPVSTEPGTVTMQQVHTVGGNNNRFRTGTVQLREDTTWRSQLHPLNRAAVTAVCAPLMSRYGYRLVH